MYRILIVDDEKIEREGIRQLIRVHKLDMETITAGNGEVALEIVRKQPIDIIITDIKMPFMDGLELSEKVREFNSNIEIIIYSAFNEFEYARRALRTNIANYLLKPIQIAEFLAVMKQAMDACEEKKAEKIRKEQLMEGYHRGLAYEREKMLLDAINGVKPLRNPSNSPELPDRSGDPWIHLFLVECGSKFFDIHNDEFLSMLADRMSAEFDYLNLNENQSVIFVRHSSSLAKDKLQTIGQDIVRGTAERFALNVSLIIGIPVNRWDLVNDAYNGIEQILEFKFFMEDHAILFADEQFNQASFDEIELNPIIEKLYQCLDYNDIQGAKYSIELLFSYLKTKGQFSSLYTKFLCSEIMNRVLSKEHRNGFSEINEYLDKISKSSSLHDLKEHMFDVFTLIESNIGSKVKNDSNHKLIRSIKQLIEEEYSQDLSLEGIAEKVYLTPSYLSYLFKKETGQSLIRYITQVRMEKAVELLRDTNMKIVDIYQKLGYRSSNYFIQTFRHHYGVTPAKFREASP